MTTVVLASASPRRRELLAALVADFEVVPADLVEDPGDDPREGAVRLAVEKAEFVARTVRPHAPRAGEDEGAVVIGSDTIVHDGRRPYGKPADGADAVAMLRALRGREHRVLTGVALVASGAVATDLSESRVTLAPLTDTTVEAYVASGRPLDKAGSYAIQDEDVPTVASLDGCYCGVMGLPLWRLRRLLERAGIACAAPEASFTRCTACPDRP